MELKVQSEKVLEAAKACPTAKAILVKLFPEVFPDWKPLINVIFEDHLKDDGPIIGAQGVREGPGIYLWTDDGTPFRLVPNVNSLAQRDYEYTIHDGQILYRKRVEK